MANRAQHERVLGMLGEARDAGGVLHTGGRAPDDPRLGAGLFVEPTVFGRVDPGAAIAQQEVFGPVLVTVPFTTESEAIAIANGTDFGLAAGIWTRDLSRAHRIARGLVAGTVWVNTYRHSAAQAPFGGMKRSGYGRERGVEAIEEYLRTKNVLIDLADSIADPFPLEEEPS